MKDRISRFLKEEGISPAKFADILNVQRSSISHYLSGRNNPSLDFIQKILSKFKYINPEWLLLGKGDMYRQGFSDILRTHATEISLDAPQISPPLEFNFQHSDTVSTEIIEPEKAKNEDKSDYVSDKQKNIEKIVVFYSDQTF